LVKIQEPPLAFIRPLKNGDLLRQRKNLTIFERPANFKFFNSQL